MSFLQTPALKSSPQPVSAEQWSCDARALFGGVCLSGVSQSVLDGVDVRRGRDTVTLTDGRQAELCTLAVKAWLISEGEECEVSPESLGQFNEGSTYAVRWTYSLTALGELMYRYDLLNWMVLHMLWQRFRTRCKYNQGEYYLFISLFVKTLK